MSSNVDDLLHGELPGHEGVMKDILDAFAVREENEGEFRFCGKEVKQDDEYNITVTTKDNTEKIRPIEIANGRKLTQKNTADETTALRSVTASLAWVARQTRPGLSFRVSKLQCIAGNGCVKDLKQANKVLEYALETSTQGLYFKAGVVDWETAVVVTCCDASLGNEDEIVKGIAEGGRSQQGFVIGLSPPDILNATDTSFHPIGWASTVIKRVCRASLHAETMALLKE